MYTGTLIDELMATVERTEKRGVRSQEENLSYFDNVVQSELAHYEPNLAGVA